MTTKPTDSQKLELLYKKYLGYPDAYPGTLPSVEAPGSARQKVFSSLQILPQTVPSIAPSVLTVDNTFTGGSNIRYTNVDYPHIVKYVKLPLTSVKPNTSFTYSYTGLPNLLTNVIPTNFDGLGSYAIYVFLNNIQVSPDKWVLDVDAGYITFFDADVTQSVSISFWRYEGEVGLNNWVGNIIPPTKGGTGVNNGTKTITLDGNLTTSGNHTTTLTTTGNTNVTLPTSGTLAVQGESIVATQMPALTGDVTTTAGSVDTTITNGAVSLSKMAQLQPNTIIGNNTASSDTPLALSTDNVKSMLGLAITSGAIPFGNSTSTGLDVDSTKLSFDNDTSTLNVQNVTVSGNLTVNGEQTILNVTRLEIEDPIIQVNKTGTLANEQKAGIEVYRGDGITTQRLIFDESDDKWKAGLNGSETNIILGSTFTQGSIPYADASGNLTQNNSGLYYSGTNLGIGTSSPQSKVHIVGSDNVVTFEGQTACFLELYPRTYANGRKAYIGYGSANTTNLDILNQDTGLLRLGTNNNAKCHVTDDGFRVGIADNDYKRLRIGGGNSEGSIYGSYDKYRDGVHFGYNYYSLDSSFVIPQQTSSGTSRISCGYGTIGLHTGGTNTEPANNALFINSSGNIGIGTTTPQKQLDVFNSACIGSPTAGSNSVFSIGSGINEYPPIALSANATTISGQNYANGSYTASASSIFSASFPEWRAFDKSPTNVWASADNSYTGETYAGAMKTTYNTNLEYSGEWIQIQLPIAVILKYFTITAVNTDSPAAPKNFAVFGSTIGSTWTLVSTLITGEIFTKGQVKSYVTSNTTEYKYYRLAINSKNNTPNNFVNLAEWRIYGYQNGTTNQLTVLPENVGIGTNTPSSSAILDITSTTKGFLMPRMTSTQVASITSPAEGLIVYDTTSDTFRYHNGTEWVYITPSGSSLFTTGSIPFANSSGSLTQNNSQLFWDNTNSRLGIGTTSPSQKLDVNGTLKTIGFDSRQVRKRAQYDISTADWYTIAKNGPINNTTTTGTVRGSAHFVVHDSSNSNHGVVEFVVITQFNGTSVLELERSGAYGNENRKWGKIQGIRIAGGGTYMGSIIEIQIESSTNLRIDMRSTVYDNITNDSSTENGWDLYSTVTQVDYSTWTNWAIRSTIDFTALTSDTVIKQLNYGSSALTTLTRNGNVGIGTSTPSSTLEVTRTAGSSTSPYFQIIQSADTAITASTEAPSVRFNLSSTRTWANGNITKQRFMLVNAPTIAFTNPTPASTVTDIATVAIDGAPKKGTNATLTNTHALLIEEGAVSTATASYGLTCNAQSGATNNYTAVFLGGNVGIGTTAPTSRLHVEGNTLLNGNVNVKNASLTSNSNDLFINASDGNDVTIRNTAGSATGQSVFNSSFVSLYSDALYINSNNNIGIGTTQPTANLHIATTNGPSNLIKCTSTHPTNGGTEDVSFNVKIDSSGNSILTMGDVFYNNTEANTTVQLHSAGNSFFNGGNLGIGTSTPVSVLNLKYVDRITSSYKYPPIGMTSTSQTVTGMDFYFNGTYTVTVSSNSTVTPTPPYNNYTGVEYGPFSTDADLLAWFCSVSYTTSTVGTYTGSNSITNVSGSQTTISGEWIKLKIPSTIVLTSYKLIGVFTVDGTGSPRTWAILGSNDGTNWDTLDNRLSSPAVPSVGVYNNNVPYTVTNTKAYTYFAFIVNTMNNGSNGKFGVSTLEFYGSPKPSAFFVENEATEPFQPFIIDYKGNVGIGVPNPTYTLHLSTDKAAKTASTTWTVTSDQRLKENILKADLDICYNNVKNITLHRFRYRDDLFNHNQIHDRSRLGWIAQEVEFLFPKAVTKQSQYGYDDCRSLDVDQLYASMYGCVQKLIEYNESNINRITDLENRYNLLKYENDEKNVKIIELENKIVNIEMQYELLLNKLKVVIPDF